MRILFVSRFFPHVGGREVLVLNLSRYLSFEHQVAIATPDIGWIANEFQIVPNESEFLAKFISNYKPDIINSHTFYLTPKVLEIARKNNIPVVLTLHGDIFGYWAPKEQGMIKAMAKHLDKIVTVCTQGAQQLVKNGIPKEKVKVIYPGINTTVFNSEKLKKDTVRKAFQLPEDKFVFIRPARLTNHKGIDVLLDVICHLEKDLRDKIFFWVTVPATRYKEEEITYGRELFQLIGARQATNKVKISFIDYSAMPLAYKATDAFVLSSVAGEQFPVSILEAMASGLPVIATDVGGVKEVVSRSTGFLIKPNSPEALANVLKQVLKNNHRMSSIADDAAQLVNEKFTLGRMANEYMALYEDLKTLKS